MTTPEDGVNGGDGADVVTAVPDIYPPADPAQPARPEDGDGTVLIRTLTGYQYQPVDDTIPMITPAGVWVDGGQAKALMLEVSHIPPTGFIYIDGAQSTAPEGAEG